VDGNYDADRLGDDVLAVMDALKLERPVLVGHSLAGEELSSVASRHPEKVAGLIYLDAAYGYAFYDSAHGDLIFDFFELKKMQDAFMAGAMGDRAEFMRDFLHTISRFDEDMQEAAKRDPTLSALRGPRGAIPPIIEAIHLGAEKYSRISLPALAIFACPHNFDFDPALRNDPATKAAVTANDAVVTQRQADAFAAGVPTARVVRIANADHYVFRSNEADVEREMDAFLATLR
jgi:pimeloyl-ACP methyl ester carboxylesterase